VFARFCALSNAVKASAEGAGAALMWNETHGFLGSCPSNIGTGLRASVMAVLPELTKNMDLLEKVCDKYDLQPRGSAGEHSAAEGGKWDISNKQRIGFSEVQLVQKMIDGVSKVIEIEERLAGGATAADILKLLSRKAIRGSLVKKSTGFSLTKRWQEREFDFDPDTHLLTYSNAGKVLGSIHTDGATIEKLPATKKGEEFRFKVVAATPADGTRNELPLQATSESEMEDWIASILGSETAHRIHASGSVLEEEVVEEEVEEESAGGGAAAAATATVGISPELRERYAAAGQEHVFQFVDNGVNTEAQNAELAAQLQSLDLERIAKLHKAAMEYDAAAAAGTNQGEIAPLDEADVAAVDDTPLELREAWRKTGMKAIANGEVAALVLSGGQGTRLGFAGPKGKYDIQLPSGKTLFQLFGERINKLQALGGEHTAEEGADAEPVKIPWAIMTSPMNHEETKTFFEEKKFFGLDEEHVHFFPQGTLPCMTNEGKLMLETGYKVGAASDGNGGIYSALKNSGVLGKFQEQGIKYVHVFSVDNAICRVADPMFLGYCISEGADCGNKVVWKTAPDEKVGVVARRDGKAHVIEYSEITKEMSEEVDEGGKLKYGAGNICNHFYKMEMLERVTDDALIFHVARKQIPVPNDKGEAVKPAEKNGIKLECFIFDAFPLCAKMAVLEGARQDEFSPVKNAPGQGLADSPDTARAMLSAQHVRWAEAAGATVLPGDRIFEVSPLQSYAGEGLEDQLNGQTIDLSGGQ
jgi:UDP-N-acetylglucosamine/UDP-N-acetylgalactosamine diphosphorylase